MWRSRALAASRTCALNQLAGAGVWKFQPGPNVPILYEVPHRHPPFSLIPNTPFPQNPRFFSQNSAAPIPKNDPEPLLPLHLIIEEAGIDFDDNAHQVFDDDDEWQEKEVGVQLELDTEKLERVRSLLSSADGSKSVESQLNEEKGLRLNLSEEFVLRVLEPSSSLIPKENLLAFSKWAAASVAIRNQNELSFTTRSVDALVQAICCSGEVESSVAYGLWDFVREVGEKENRVVTTEVLNLLISCFSRLDEGLAGYEVFSKFGDFSCVPDADSYYYTLEGLCRCSTLDRIESVLDKMLNVEVVLNKMLNEEKLPEPEKIGKLICLLCKVRKVKEAHSVYLSAKRNEKYPPESSVDDLISSLCDREECDAKSVYAALEILEDFSEVEKQKYAIKPSACVIRGLCRIKDVKQAKTLLFKMIDAGPPPEAAVFNTIINSLSKAGDLEEAERIMKVMERSLKPNIYTYTVIMSGYVKGGEMEKAVKVLTEAKKNHQNLSPEMYHTIIRGYCNGGEMEKAVELLAEAKKNIQKLSPVMYHTIIRGYCNIEEHDKAVKLLAEMKKCGVQPTADEYNMLIQSLCLKATDWVTAEKLVEEMKKNGLLLNGNTVALVRAVKELDEEGVGEDKEVEAK